MIEVGTLADFYQITDSYVLTTGNSGSNQERNVVLFTRWDSGKNKIIVQGNGYHAYSGITRMDVVVEYTKTK